MMVEVQLDRLRQTGVAQVLQVLDTGEATESSIQMKLAMITTTRMEMDAVQHEVSKLDGFVMVFCQYAKSEEMESNRVQRLEMIVI